MMSLIPSILLCLSINFAQALPTKQDQFRASLRSVISNSTRPDVRAGMVVASPSRRDPDYYYDWVRDTALTMRSLIDYYEIKKDPKIKKMIFTWVEAETYRQGLPTLSGLGEPKYFIDGSGYTGPWGRPQNDGPALRAIAMIKFARLMLAEGNQDYVIKNLYRGILPADSVIKKDLEYTARSWIEHSFDLWEEEKGVHFYTLMAQQVALQEGSKLAAELGDGGAAQFYRSESIKVAQKIKREFIHPRLGIIVTTQRSAALGYKNQGLDVAPLLALLHTYPYQNIFALGDYNIQKYINQLITTFGDIYAINKAFPDLGVSLGRYPEDRYDGYQTSSQGNPWFLSTLALAEFYCLEREEASRKRPISALARARSQERIERQFQRALFHSNRQGQMSEQFNQNTGHMQGAPELTWSYNAFMTAMMRCKLI
jgi:glucoamylase